MNKQTQKELLQIVEKNYEEITEQFDETRKKHLWPELVNLTSQVKNNALVLDIGCGNGRLLEAFQDKKINYLGVDKSRKLIALAKEKYAKHKFVTGDILDLGKLPEINFDYVFCIAVLQHIPGKNLQIDALKQLRNKISDKGEIIIVVWNMWAQKKFRNLIIKFFLLKLIRKNKMDLGDVLFDWKNAQGLRVSKRYYHAFRKGELKRVIKKAGLKIESLYNDRYNYYAVLSR
ncbi:MAG: class I SAM-dependent methyltransferase [Candidatus Falkowbacteria bacterium]|nr:class I SAM-dependent methyltransferase [Candidatus Falkowbacteria bacterium]